MHIKFKKLHKDAIIPQYAHLGEDAGLDLTCTEIYFNDDFIGYKTGIAVEIPQGYVGLLFPRSSNCKKDLLLCNSVGILDSGFRGEIEFRYKRIFEPSKVCPKRDDFYTTIYQGYKQEDRVGQLLVIPYPEIEPIEVKELSESQRGKNGYGSSGQ